MKIYGRASSSNVQKVTWCCDELDIGYERIDMGREFGGNREAPYLAMNPNGTIPTIVEDDGFVLWESNATSATWRSATARPASIPAIRNVRRSPSNGWTGS